MLGVNHFISYLMQCEREDQKRKAKTKKIIGIIKGKIHQRRLPIIYQNLKGKTKSE